MSNDPLLSYHLSNWLIYNVKQHRSAFPLSKNELNNIYKSNIESIDWIGSNYLGYENSRKLLNVEKITVSDDNLERGKLSNELLLASEIIIAKTKENQRIKSDLNLKNLYLKGEIAALKGDNDSSIKIYKQCLKINPSVVNVYSLLFELYDKCGQYNKASSILKEGIENCKDNSLLIDLLKSYQK